MRNVAIDYGRSEDFIVIAPHSSICLQDNNLFHILYSTFIIHLLFFSQVVVGTLQVLGSLGCMLVMKTLGKRGLSFISMSVCVACAVALVIYILLNLFSPWIPMVLFCLLFFTAQLGIGSIPWMLISEVFPIQ